MNCRYKRVFLVISLTFVLTYAPASNLEAGTSCKAECPGATGTYSDLGPDPATEARATGYVRSEGRHILGPDGVPFRMKGFNLPDWLQVEGWLVGDYTSYLGGIGHEYSVRQYLHRLVEDYGDDFYTALREAFYRKEDLATLRQLGANTFRIPIAYWVLNDRLGGFRYLDRMIDWARELDAYVVLTIHSAPGCQNASSYCNPLLAPDDSPLFDVETYQHELAAVWSELAARYKDEPVIAAYNLLNEPNNFPHTLDKKEEVLKVYANLIRTIRQFDANHMIILDGDEYATTLDVFRSTLFSASGIFTNVAISFHSYYSSSCDPADSLFEEEAVELKAEELRKHFDQILAAVVDQEIPVIVGEYGARCMAAQRAYHHALADKGLIHALYYAPFGIREPEEYDLILCRFRAPNWESYIQTLSRGLIPSTRTALAAFLDFHKKTGLVSSSSRVCDMADFFAE